MSVVGHAAVQGYAMSLARGQQIVNELNGYVWKVLSELLPTQKPPSETKKAGQRPAFLNMVAGAGFEPTTFGL